jgi:hypothetical protein
VQFYCDESGGVGRGVMTLAGVAIAPDDASKLLNHFCTATGLRSELKGSRINLDERAFFFDLFDQSKAHATVAIALSATRPALAADHGDHDQMIYASLLEDVVGAMIEDGPTCAGIVIDDGRYDAQTLAAIRADIAALVGPCGSATLEHSHRLPGLQIADVIANTFFNRALVNDRQPRMAALVAPFLADGRIKMRILAA